MNKKSGSRKNTAKRTATDEAAVLAKISAIVEKIRDPWDNPRTRIWEDGTYTGDGLDLINCRDAIHDLKELLGQS